MLQIKVIIKFVLLLILLYLNVAHSFEGVGECSKLLTDFAFLLDKSVYLPKALSGNCVIKRSADIPKILKAAGYNYKEQNNVITLTEIKPLDFKPWRAPLKRYKVSFAFLNKSSMRDCGAKMSDVIAALDNISMSFSLALTFGCPALDEDGSFGFSVDAALYDYWHYTHGIEQQRSKSTITSNTGAVTTDYEYLTTGLDLELRQTEIAQTYKLRYTSNSGSVTTSEGAITQLVQSDVTEVYKKQRKFLIIPLGTYNVESSYKMLLQIKELK